MRVQRVTATNFGSYRALDLGDLDTLGLALLHGKTGAGKSTVMDMVSWGLFGVTAKDGKSDDIKSWTAAGEATEVCVFVSTGKGDIYVKRTRGGAKQDLFWTEQEASSIVKRGKDLPDTQKLLDARLGISADTFIASSYFHEFSQTGGFFTANAKARRSVFENLVDLSWVQCLVTSTSDSKKEVKFQLEKTQALYNKAKGRQEELKRTLNETEWAAARWSEKQSLLIRSLAEKDKCFHESQIEDCRRLRKALQQVNPKTDSFYQKDLADIRAQKEVVKDTKCIACGIPTGAENLLALTRLEMQITIARNDNRALLNRRANLETQIQDVESRTNHYGEQLETEKSNENPFNFQLQDTRESLNSCEQYVALLDVQLGHFMHRHDSMNHLIDLYGDLRGELLKKVVMHIEDSTNKYLETYFDAEIRAGFSLDGADNLEVALQKSGHECTYKQLSKGQRGLLKLCFVVAVMEASANKVGMHFDNLWFDEALDGMDSEMKVKAFGLFESIAKNRASVLVIDHSEELKTMFTKSFHVTMISDQSKINEES